MKEYVVYFKQVNASMYRVVALNKQEALKRAKREWELDFMIPELQSIELIDEGVRE